MKATLEGRVIAERPAMVRVADRFGFWEEVQVC